MISSLLVANRGEIAVRIFRTARSMGVKCIAVYSDADAKAKHVRDADVALRIGPPPASESYLNAEAILRAAKESRAEAIHPGYGFLSENPDFAEAVIAAGLIWVGPTPAAIRALGLKDEAKRIAEEAGVPVLPGYRGADQSEKVLLSAAKEIGFPVLIKAVAGGGGRGIREVNSAGEFSIALASAKREAAAAFGDDRVLIEKFIARARHIEVQVFGDSHGNLVHLFERDCSLQRRRQKVIEEAPAPGMTEEVRAAMTGAALKLARAVKYENAGTVEFIVDATGPLRPDAFWFMEMNTRLQVEHPVTEMITGLDLVEWQLRVASGETLPLTQDEIEFAGHAIEARICAEDPQNGFQPSIGKILAFSSWRGEAPSVRVDAGYDERDSVSQYYDNLLAKTISIAETRHETIAELDYALSQTGIAGIATNTGFLVRCLRGERFIDGAVDTGLIEESGDRLLSNRSAVHGAGRAYAGSLFEQRSDSGSPWDTVDGWRLNGLPARHIAVEVTGIALTVDVDDGADIDAMLFELGRRTFVTTDGETFEVWRAGARSDDAAAEGGDTIIAPLPGKIVALNVAPGASVKRGDPLVVVEAMKMEHALKAPRDGVVAEIGASEGEQVKQGQMLVKLEEKH